MRLPLKLAREVDAEGPAPAMPELEKHVTVEHAADLAATRPVTIRRLVERGELRAIRIGGRLKISAPSLAAFFARAATAPHRQAPPALLAVAGRTGGRRRPR